MARDSHDAVEFMERMVDAIGLRPGLPQADREAKLASLYGEAQRAFSDPDLRDAAIEYLDRWKNEAEGRGPDQPPG